MNGFVQTSKRQIREVWADNLQEEFERIRDIVDKYPYIAMDTEFPGIVARPTGNFDGRGEYNYQTVKCNVDLLKVIQLGLTFADSHGNEAPGISTWQFNFKFDLGRDMYAQDSIEFLKQSGIDFEKHQEKGVEVVDFGELIMASGLVMNDEVKWISFHGSYDFGYLLKLLTCTSLPERENTFFDLLHDYFPALYDIKFLLRSAENLKLTGGASLQRIAEHLAVERVGPQHQAGSDSLVTCRTFFRLMATYFDNQIDDSKFSGIIYGLGPSLANVQPMSMAPIEVATVPHPHLIPPQNQSSGASNQQQSGQGPPGSAVGGSGGQPGQGAGGGYHFMWTTGQLPGGEIGVEGPDGPSQNGVGPGSSGMPNGVHGGGHAHSVVGGSDGFVPPLGLGHSHSFTHGASPGPSHSHHLGLGVGVGPGGLPPAFGAFGPELRSSGGALSDGSGWGPSAGVRGSGGASSAHGGGGVGNGGGGVNLAGLQLGAGIGVGMDDGVGGGRGGGGLGAVGPLQGGPGGGVHGHPGGRGGVSLLPQLALGPGSGLVNGGGGDGGTMATAGGPSG